MEPRTPTISHVSKDPCGGFPGKTACIRCIFPEKPPQGSLETCEIVGVLGPVAGIAGLISATEAVKYLVGKGDLLINKLLYLDLTDFSIELMDIQRNINCNVCVHHQFETLEEITKSTRTISLCGRNSYQVIPAQTVNLNLIEFGEKLERNPEFKISVITDILIAMEYTGHPITLFRDGRLLMRNVQTENEAKSIASKILSF